jgi:hypothetical protein
MILFKTLSASNSKLTNESVSIVLILHSVIIPLSSNLSRNSQISVKDIYNIKFQLQLIILQ